MTGAPRYAFHCFNCGVVIFYIDHMPKAGETQTIESVTLPNGEQPVVGSTVDCSLCGYLPAHPFDRDQIREVH